nr:MAG: hypothetical protein DIU56_04710 [Pseudomonadota bacterium]
MQLRDGLMDVCMQRQDELDPSARGFYRRTLALLSESGVQFLVGGAYALARYTGIERHTKDFDIFIRSGDYDTVMKVLERAGCRTELTFPHWLGKAHCGDSFIDVIFSSGNGIARVDEEWFEHSVDGEVLGLPVRLCPAEEMIWSKAFIMERERYDGADIMHLLRACGDRLDWPRLLRRFGPHWRVLLKHLVMFGFVYPCERNRIPRAVMRELLDRLEAELDSPPPSERVCYGTIVSRAQYLIDVECWGMQDARLVHGGPMSDADVAHWTAAIHDDK